MARAILGILKESAVEATETPEAKAARDQKNDELKAQGMGFIFAPPVMKEWGFSAYKDMRAVILASGKLQKHLPEAPVKLLQKGDLVKIFKTVTDGDVLWQGTIDLDRSKHMYGTQRNMPLPQWGSMFSGAMPARLEREGRVIHGALYLHYETGMEGMAPCVQEYGMPGYAGLHDLRDGDKLTVFSKVRKGEVEWEGKVDFDGQGIVKIHGMNTALNRTPVHMSAQDWQQLYWEHRPIIVKPAAP